MEKCYCIIIDDSAQIIESEMIGKIKESLRKNAIDLELFQLNPKEDGLIDEEDGKILMDKVIQRLDTQDYLKRHIHLIICDYELGDKEVNGFEIIRDLRNKLGSRKEIILYSSNIEDVIKKIIARDGDQTKSIKDLVSAKIFDFCVKDEHLSSAIIKAIKAETEYSSDKFLEEELFRHGEYPFKAIYEKFEGKTLGQVAEIITRNGDEGVKFKKEIISQVVAYLTEVN